MSLNVPIFYWALFDNANNVEYVRGAKTKVLSERLVQKLITMPGLDLDGKGPLQLTVHV